jgi:hypothetical protein
MTIPAGLCATLAALLAASSLPERAGERRAFLAARSRQETAEILRALPQSRLLQLGLEAVRELGSYSARVRKQERVGDKLLDPQQMAITVREQPFALRMQVIAGPKAGRKVLYNEQLRKGQFRVREAGILGIKALWLDLDSGLARRDTNHRVTDLGFGPILRQLGRDMQLAARYGGHQRADERFDEQGRWCLTFIAPPAAAGQLYAERTRMCLDLALALPVAIDVYDARGLLERVELTDVKRETALPETFFSLDAAGL